MRVTFEDIQAAIERHHKFLAGEVGGQKADLHGADLYSANLMDVNLSGADLSGANLKRSILFIRQPGRCKPCGCQLQTCHPGGCQPEICQSERSLFNRGQLGESRSEGCEPGEG